LFFLRNERRHFDEAFSGWSNPDDIFLKLVVTFVHHQASAFSNLTQPMNNSTLLYPIIQTFKFASRQANTMAYSLATTLYCWSVTNLNLLFSCILSIIITSEII